MARSSPPTARGARVAGVDERRPAAWGILQPVPGGFGTLIKGAARDPAALVELELRSGARIHARLRLSLPGRRRVVGPGRHGLRCRCP